MTVNMPERPAIRMQTPLLDNRIKLISNTLEKIFKNLTSKEKAPNAMRTWWTKITSKTF